MRPFIAHCRCIVLPVPHNSNELQNFMILNLASVNTKN